MARIIMEMDTKTGVRTFQVEDVQGEACIDFTKAITEANEVIEGEKTEAFCGQQESPDFIHQQGD